jgi:hypothetical protein
MRADFNRFGSNRLSVITFNYDRSLEHFLYTCLCNTHNKPSDEAAAQLAHIPIVHVYGQLGRLEWQPNNANCLPRPYTNDLDIDSISRAAGGIKIIAEHRDKNPEFLVAHDLMMKADRILFIGFGYDKMNITRLSVPWDDTSDFRLGQRLVGTSFGLTGVERKRIMQRCHGLDLLEFDALQFLRNCEDFSWQ